jgi:hypothetical protein
MDGVDDKKASLSSLFYLFHGLFYEGVALIKVRTSLVEQVLLVLLKLSFIHETIG